MPHTLIHHLNALPPESIVGIRGNADVTVTAPFVEDSRKVERGGVFVARAGLQTDGHDYIQQAIDQGAVAVIGEYPWRLGMFPYVQVRDIHLALGRLAASYHDFPSRKLTVFGVTGTNGKTTTIHLLHAILKHHTGGKAGFISTIEADFGERNADTGLHVTTPTASETQAYLAQMVDSGLTHVALEMTSHGLAQGRVAGVDIDVAVLTNLTHEHLDFHGSFENYRAAKGIMFEMLMQSHAKPDTPKISVLNADDDSYDYYRTIAADRRVSYGITQIADKRPTAITYAPDGTHIQLGEARFTLKLVGEFNVYNALAAISAAQAIGASDEAIQRGLDAVTAISGRMQRIDEGQDFMAIVDFAHTPDALEKALEAGRAMLPTGNKLIAVFGSAGLRDVEKRRMMAETSAQLADITVLTAEDPRTESLDDILQMMAEGCIKHGGVEGKTFIRVPDRGAAIYQACRLAQVGDIVMACGKGHEQSMCFGTIEYPWDDREAMRAALKGTPLATLPTAQT